MNTLSATFHLTHHCNLRCTYCYTGEKILIAMNYSTIDQSIVFLRKKLDTMGSRKLAITFFGGEPLIEADKIFYIIDKVNQWSEITLCYRMSTNGTLLTESLMQKLYDHQVFVSLSSDVCPEVHDRHRLNAAGKPSSHKVAQAARLMLRQNPATNVTCVTSPVTATHLCESVDYLFGLGFRYITTTLDYSADWGLKHFALLKNSYQKLSKWYIQKLERNERFYLSFFDERIRTRTYKPIEAQERCLIGIKQFSIALSNGELYPCIQFVKTDYQMGG